MITFKKFFESNDVLGLIETITFKELGPIAAKIDSGNGAYNVLHGTDISEKNGKVTFTTVNSKILTKPLKEYIDINVGSGNIEQRPVVVFDIKIGGKIHKNTKFSIGNRTENDYKILVGKDFIEKLGGVIDVTIKHNLD